MQIYYTATKITGPKRAFLITSHSLFISAGGGYRLSRKKRHRVNIGEREVIILLSTLVLSEVRRSLFLCQDTSAAVGVRLMASLCALPAVIMGAMK